MYCLTREDMKFEKVEIPKKTKCKVISKLGTTAVDVPGVNVRLAIDLHELGISRIKDENKDGWNGSEMTGIVISTSIKDVFMDAGDRLYDSKELYDFKVDKVLEGERYPIEIIDYSYGEKNIKYLLRPLVEHLEMQFESWVHENCEFREITTEDIENEDFSSEWEGGRTLTEKGLEDFYKKKEEYQSKLEKIGFTYDFDGGLCWE